VRFARGCRVVGVLVVALSLGACSGGSPTVSEVFGAPGSDQLEVSVDTCNASPEVSAEESGAEVRLIVDEGEASGDGGDDCRDSVMVTLEEPLGQREVVDGATGDPVVVQPADG